MAQNVILYRRRRELIKWTAKIAPSGISEGATIPKPTQGIALAKKNNFLCKPLDKLKKL
jgi:hypothetical protein